MLSLLQLALAATLHFGASQALPIGFVEITKTGGMSSSDPQFWVFLAIAAALVLLGGAFAGLTIA